jgi:hypothetical protein
VFVNKTTILLRACVGIYNLNVTSNLIPIVERSKTRVCGRSLVGIAVSKFCFSVFLYTA